jgi:phosphatidylinositol alpha-mannosyltransferase
VRIAITSPTTWPWVRRGGERFINELARYLAGRGHQATIISAKPGPRQVIRSDGYTTVCHRRLWHPKLARIGLLEFHAFFLPCFLSLFRGRYDVVLCSTFLDTYAATVARRRTGTPCIFWVNSLPPRVQYFRSLTLGGAVYRRAMAGADEVIALSAYAQEYLARRFGRPGIRIPVPIDLDAFRLESGRDHERPVIFCAAALNDERKGGRLLMRAFDRLKTVRPDAVLALDGALTEETRTELLGLVSLRWRRDVSFLSLLESELPRAFGRAAVSVLPSRWEAFGMVVIESLASGTPVVGARDGAIPELIGDDRIGRLFDPGPPVSAEPTNVDGLVQALVEALELSQRPETAARCRARAERFSWSQVGPEFEALFEGLANEHVKRAGARNHAPT